MLASILFFMGVLLSSANGEMKAGTKSKDFTVSSLDGGEITLTQLRGKVVLINFWATWCAPCREELPQLAALQEKLRKPGLIVLAISVDNEAENIAAFMQQHGLKLPAFWDRDKRVSKLYDPQTMPSSYLIDRNGILRYVHNGYSPAGFKLLEAEIGRLLKPGAPAAGAAKGKSP